MILRRLALIGLIATVSTLLAATPALAQDPNPRIISTTGDATVYAVPDEAVVTLGVEIVNAKLDEAKSQNDDRSASLLRAIKALEIEEKYVSTDQLNIEVNYRGENRDVVSFTTRRTYRVTLKDVSKLQPLIDAAFKSGANVLYGAELKTTELRKHRDEARSMAVKAAKEKAQALAGELDCSIGAPRSISESSGYWTPWQAHGMQMQNVSADVGGGAAATGETTPLGQIAIQATVSVTFDLIPK